MRWVPAALHDTPENDGGFGFILQAMNTDYLQTDQLSAFEVHDAETEF